MHQPTVVLLRYVHGALYLECGLQISHSPFCGNLNALYMTINFIFHARKKHNEFNYHFVCEKVAIGSLVTRYV
jgi:hypothetical protein